MIPLKMIPELRTKQFNGRIKSSDGNQHFRESFIWYSSKSLNKAFSKFPSYLFNNSIVSYLITVSGYQEDVWKACGTIKTGHTPNWKVVFNADKKKFIPERNSQGVKLVGRKGRKTGNELDNIKELKNQNSKFKSNIKALKKRVTNDNDEGDDNDKTEDAGDQFGVKQCDKKSKKNWLPGLHYYPP